MLLAWLFRGAVIRAGGNALARGTVKAVTGATARSGAARAATSAAATRSATASAIRSVSGRRIARAGAVAIPLGGTALAPTTASAASSYTLSTVESILSQLYGYVIYRAFESFDQYGNQVINIPESTVVLSQNTGLSIDGRVQAEAAAQFSLSHGDIKNQNVLVEQYMLDLDSNDAVPVSSGAMYVAARETENFSVHFKSLLWPGRKTIVTKINNEIIHATEPFYVA